MRTNSLAISRAKTQSVGNSSTAPLSDPACHPSSCLPPSASGSASLVLNFLSVSFLPRVSSFICPISCTLGHSPILPPPPPAPHSRTSATIQLYFILRELEVRGDGPPPETHVSRKICREAKGLILWQTPRMTVPSSPQTTKLSRMPPKSFIPISRSSPPSTARFSSPKPHQLSLHP